jgi:type 1 fimbria pilin
VKNFKKLMACLLGISMFFLALPALARYTDCTAVGMPLTITASNLSVLSTLQPGQTIPGSRTPISLVIKCNYSFPANSIWQLTGLSSVNSTAYANVYTWGSLASSGIGVRVLDNSGTPQPYLSRGFSLGSATGTTTISAAVELVKLSNTISTQQQSTSWYISVDDQQWANQSSGGSQLNFNYNVSRPSVPTCSVKSTSLSVNLPTVNKSAFKGMGSAAAPAAFNLSLQCDANVQANLTFSDMTRPDNSGDSLALASGSSAKGVAVQMLSQGRPIRLAPSGQSGGSVLDVSTAASAQLVSVPLAAQYLQVESGVVPGTVTAAATFTLTYP